MGEFGHPVGAKLFEIFAGVMRRAGQRARRNQEETLGRRHGGERLELFRGDEALYRVVLLGRRQVLADGQEVDIGLAQVVHQLQDFVPLLAEPDHDARLGEHGRIEFLYPLQQADRMEVAGAGTDLEVL